MAAATGAPVGEAGSGRRQAGIDASMSHSGVVEVPVAVRQQAMGPKMRSAALRLRCPGSNCLSCRGRAAGPDPDRAVVVVMFGDYFSEVRIVVGRLARDGSIGCSHCWPVCGINPMP